MKRCPAQGSAPMVSSRAYWPQTSWGRPLAQGLMNHPRARAAVAADARRRLPLIAGPKLPL
eukprot:8796654-Pyramimonas_sp.AAC.1